MTTKLTAAVPRLKLTFVREPGKKYVVRTPEDLSAIVAYLRHEPEEVFVAVHFDAKHNAIGLHEVSRGTLSASLVHPREVFKSALLSNCHAIAFAHNHPTGETTPSSDDIKTTEQLIGVAKLLGIAVLDHIIVGDDFRSMRSEEDVEDWT